MKKGFAGRWVLALAAVGALGAPGARGMAQEPQESSSKRPLEEGETRPKASPLPARPAAPEQPKFDPLRAEKDIEVGRYYMRKGDVDAAMDRFQDAIESRPNYALPYLLLGEAQQKKGLKREAVRSFTRYLEVFPHAEDAAKVRKRIGKLQSELEKKHGKAE